MSNYGRLVGPLIFLAVMVIGVYVLASTIQNSVDGAITEYYEKEETFLKTQIQPEWEEVVVTRPNGNIVTSVGRTKTPTGWLIYSHQNVTFVPDPEHKWLATKVEQDK